MSVTGFDPHSQQLLCSRFIASGQWDRAVEAAREWLANDPQNARAHQNAAQALINLDRNDEAETHLRRVLATQPQNATAHRFLSIVLFEQQRYREADEFIHKAIALNPGDFYNWYHLASMFYQQGDLESARKYGAKAMEINPRNPNIINLMALCEPRDSAHAHLRLERYQQALELDPENAQVHNNLGAYYLNEGPNYARAEECFRRALFFDPNLQMARSNLFLALKHRDPIYRCLRAPKDFLMRGFTFMGRQRRQNLLIYILLLPLWFLAIRYVIGGLALWCLLVWPMVKVYEGLTLGDIRAQAGEIGARRGGFLGYRRWSVRTRMGIFAALLIAFWSGVGVEAYQFSQSQSSEQTQATLGLLLFCAMIGFIIYQLRRMISRRRLKTHAKRRGTRFAGILGGDTQPRKWWPRWRRSHRHE